MQLVDDFMSARRRAELLGILDELGPAALAPPKPYPSFTDRNKGHGMKNKGPQESDIFAGAEEEAAASLSMVSNFIDAARLRDSGALPDGGYFAHVLHTRRVSKVRSASLSMLLDN